MRAAVLVSELALATFVFWLFCAQDSKTSTTVHQFSSVTPFDRQEPVLFWRNLSGLAEQWTNLLFLPAALIDHAHTQHNSIAVLFTGGWAILATRASYAGKSSNLTGCAAGVLFVLALNFKQMSLFYAMPVFLAHLTTIMETAPNWTARAFRLFSLAVTVLVSQGALMIPLCSHGSRGCLAVASQVLHRVFPTQRGLFEDKVANIWCAIEPLLKLRRQLALGLISRHHVLTLSACLTFALSLPMLYFVAFRWVQLERNRRLSLLLVSCSGVAQAFFLAAFQVHEKSILFPLAALEISLAVNKTVGSFHDWLRSCTSWFRVHALISLLPLLLKDGAGLVSALVTTCCIVIALRSAGHHKRWRATHICIFLAQTACVAAYVLLRPPLLLPDLYLYLVAMTSTAAFIFVWTQIVMHITEIKPKRL
jgi:alpha-1,3-glucosyltransferase